MLRKIDELFDLRPKAIEERLKLRNPIYEETASYGHMGREPKVVTKTYESMYHEAKTLGSGTVHLGEAGLCG